MKCLLVLSTVPPSAAAALARQLVEQDLAACVNILPQISSCYRWEGQLENSDESLLLIKCRADRYLALENGLKALHPYAVPEIIALEIDTGLPAYLAWLAGPQANE